MKSADQSTDLCCAPIGAAVLSSAEADALAHAFAALADPIRLRIFSIIATEGEVCSCNLEGPLERSQPTISHHTSKLASAGLIVGERRGRWMWWRVAEAQVAAMAEALTLKVHQQEPQSLH
jgi:ArsR family transcriptional regulator, arsenate/arsenite/antimonite-responsive transcriptional repressor